MALGSVCLTIILTLAWTIVSVFSVPNWAFADEGTTVLVWVNDENTDRLMGAAFTDEALGKTISRLNENGFTDIKTVLLRNTKKKEEPKEVEQLVRNAVAQAISGTQRISNIILATHGGVEGDETTLAYLGGFGAKGVSGPLKSILKQLSPKFGSKLHVYLDSCSTFCGSESAVLSRVSGFAEELSRLGVKTASFWGATQLMNGAAAPENVEIKEVLYRLNKYAVPRAILAGVGVGSVAFTMLSDLTFNQSYLPASLWIGGGLAAATLAVTNAFAYYIGKKTSDYGLLVISTDQGLSSIPAVRRSKEAFWGLHSGCALLLERQQVLGGPTD